MPVLYFINSFSSRFKLEPTIFSLKPNEEIELVITTQNKKKEEVQEEWFFHAMIEKIEQKQIIIETIITITFVDPTLFISKMVMNFRSDRNSEKNTCINVGKINKVYTDFAAGTIILFIFLDMVQIVNISPVPLEMDLITKAPFFMMVDDMKIYKLILRLKPDELFYLNVYFDSSSAEKYCFVVEQKLQIKFHNHPNKASIHIQYIKLNR